MNQRDEREKMLALDDALSGRWDAQETQAPWRDGKAIRLSYDELGLISKALRRPAQRAPETKIAEGRQLCECPQCGRNHWHLGTPPKPKATIEELEAILNSESTDQVEILSDGTVRRSALTSTERGAK